jgi:hypothetical protein
VNHQMLEMLLVEFGLDFWDGSGGEQLAPLMGRKQAQSKDEHYIENIDIRTIYSDCYVFREN